ncbi:MAG: 8-oxo-dGTP diphosphatase [Candidatus Micrarchaeia archaeon]
MRDATLCFLIDEGRDSKRILLGMKKRGFGVNKWNGFGGKINEGESIEDAACRELFEEVGVMASKRELAKVGELYFYFPHEERWNQIVHVFFVRKWEGQPRESEEMKPQWFDVKEIPYKEMWVDDEYWLPTVIEGKQIRGKFIFGKDNETLLEQEIKEIDGKS